MRISRPAVVNILKARGKKELEERVLEPRRKRLIEEKYFKKIYEQEYTKERTKVLQRVAKKRAKEMAQKQKRQGGGLNINFGGTSEVNKGLFG